MKKHRFHHISLFLLLLTASACGDNNDDIRIGCEITYSRHFVGEYIDVKGIVINDHIYPNRGDGDKPYVFYIDFDECTRYYAPEVSAGIESWTEEQRQRNDTRFMELAHRYGDLTYRRGWMLSCDHLCSSEPFHIIQIICLNHSFDEAHPAGRPLDDIVKAELLSYRDYIRGGYEPFFVEGEVDQWNEFSIIEKYLADLTMDDLQLFDVNRTALTLYLDRSYLAAPGDYEFKVTMVSESGKTFEAEYTLSVGSAEVE